MSKENLNKIEIFEEINSITDDLKKLFKNELIFKPKIEVLDKNSTIIDFQNNIQNNLAQCELLGKHIDKFVDEKVEIAGKTLKGLADVQYSIINELKRLKIIKKYESINEKIEREFSYPNLDKEQKNLITINE